MDELTLAQLVAPHGNIEVMKIVRDKRTNVCKGYAFVEMAGDAHAVAVMAALDGVLVADRRLSVKLAAIRPAAPPHRTPSKRPVENSRKLRTRRPRL